MKIKNISQLHTDTFLYEFELVAADVDRQFVSISKIDKLTGETNVLEVESDCIHLFVNHLISISKSESPIIENITNVNVSPVSKTYTLAGKREEHARAYEKWSQDEDDELISIYNEGYTTKQMSEHLGRNKGAIRSRLMKLMT